MNPALSEAEALSLIERCLKVLYYRDCRAHDKVCVVGVGVGHVLKVMYVIVLSGALGLEICTQTHTSPLLSRTQMRTFAV